MKNKNCRGCPSSILFLLTCIASLLLSTPALAWDIHPAQTLLLTIINHSDQTLHFSGIKSTNPGNRFMLNTREIFPGGSALLTATTSSMSDLALKLRFSSGKKNNALLHILDPQNTSKGKPGGTFRIDSKRFVSFVLARDFSNDNHPYSLTCTAATLEIQNRLSS